MKEIIYQSQQVGKVVDYSIRKDFSMIIGCVLDFDGIYWF